MFFSKNTPDLNTCIESSNSVLIIKSLGRYRHDVFELAPTLCGFVFSHTLCRDVDGYVFIDLNKGVIHIWRCGICNCYAAKLLAFKENHYSN